MSKFTMMLCLQSYPTYETNIDWNGGGEGGPGWGFVEDREDVE